MPQAPSLRTDEFFTIFIRHLPTSKFVTFEGWITAFSDQFSSNWSPTSVYGRQDPLVAFENTQRSITLEFDVVSDSATQAEKNLDAIANLIKFQYPVYESSERAAQNTLKAAPLIQMKWTNLLSDAKTRDFLTGYLNGVTYGPDITEGGFVIGRNPRSEVDVNGEVRQGKPISNPELFASVVSDQAGKDVIISNFDVSNPGKFFIPKKVNIQLTFNVLHTHLTGWYRNGEGGGSYFFGSNELSAKYPNAASKERIVSQTTALAESGIVGTINFDPAEEANDAQILESD